MAVETIVWLSIVQATSKENAIQYSYIVHCLLYKHDALKTVCKRGGPCSSLLVAVDLAGMSAFVRIVLSVLAHKEF